MPLFVGATSRVILANEAPRIQRRIHLENEEDIRSKGLISGWKEFTALAATIRRQGCAESASEVTPNVAGHRRSSRRCASGAGTTHIIRALIRIEDPDHSALRAITSQWFLPTTVAELKDQVADLAREAVDSMLALDGACDFSRDVANPYPLRVILSILGMEREDEAAMGRLTQELFGPQDPDTKRDTSAAHYALWNTPPASGCWATS